MCYFNIQTFQCAYSIGKKCPRVGCEAWETPGTINILIIFVVKYPLPDKILHFWCQMILQYWVVFFFGGGGGPFNFFWRGVLILK